MSVFGFQAKVQAEREFDDRFDGLPNDDTRDIDTESLEVQPELVQPEQKTSRSVVDLERATQRIVCILIGNDKRLIAR